MARDFGPGPKFRTWSEVSDLARGFGPGLSNDGKRAAPTQRPGPAPQLPAKPAVDREKEHPRPIATATVPFVAIIPCACDRMRFATIRSFSLICLAAMTLASCASGPGPMIDHIPTWLDGEPAGVPPRPGTPEYDAWQARRAQDAETVKSK
jgi:hypothetical protein